MEQQNAEKKSVRNTDKIVKVLFGIRIVLWVIALAATIYWIYWSFYIYETGIHLVEDYAKAFRPIFGKSLLVTIISILVSFLLRHISDKLKKSGVPK